MSDKALEDLQIRMTFLEQHLDELSGIIHAQNARIDKIHLEIERLQQYQSRDTQPDSSPEPPPPHY